MKKELYEYAFSYSERFGKSNLSSSFGLEILINSIFMLPLFFIKWWLGVSVGVVYGLMILKMKKEKSIYAKNLLCIFLFVFFFSISGLFGLADMYGVHIVSLIIITIVICLYEIFFLIKLKLRKYSKSNQKKKYYKKMSFILALMSVTVGRILGNIFIGVKWFAFVAIILLSLILTFSITLSQRYVVFKILSKNTGDDSLC